MPINENEWSKGRVQSQLKPTILKFLEGNRSQAFTEMEIIELVEQFSCDSTSFLLDIESSSSIRQALEELTIDKKIQSKLIERENLSSVVYYKYI